MISKEDIDSMFTEFDDYFVNKKQNRFSVRQQFYSDAKLKDAPQDNFRIELPHNLWRHGFTETFIVSPAWIVFKMRARRPDRYDKFMRACNMILSGLYSMREIRRQLGWHRITIRSLFRKLTAIRLERGIGEICCPCGIPIQIHRGWCKYRFGKSEKRQAFMKVMHSKQQKPIVELTEQDSLTTLKVLDELKCETLKELADIERIESKVKKLLADKELKLSDRIIKLKTA